MTSAWRRSSASGSGRTPATCTRRRTAEVDRLLLPLVLEYARGNLQQASHILGIARQTLRLKLRDLGLSVRRSAEVEEDDQP